ncbi:hypothetical protein TTHERM_000389729 (macronuclear) [Tetrahymena thermophila SB210]|uniref:Uncharacterized protein n=1 Tax=Tetrahymena thermophila (strain SB210) TaxID=312017 RepID=W7X2R2_TETTS|nr:hypothetical protein TTHERM_000389729 [Tetrahymena thermophila SB210]EWS73575.1 hypothetical protein TTHERM_000389729 [Tetrahymena thermophila SB210]|eukprot:XP_012653898.1 hypothetical protein TTHERM_000389729 [Tetrahymena thermophila SB210]
MRRKKDQNNHSLHQFLKPFLIKSYHFLSALNGPLGVHCDHNQNKVFQDNSNQKSHGDIKIYHQRSILIQDIFQSFQLCKKQCPRLLFRKAKCQSYPSVTCRSSELEKFVLKRLICFKPHLRCKKARSICHYFNKVGKPSLLQALQYIKSIVQKQTLEMNEDKDTKKKEKNKQIKKQQKIKIKNNKINKLILEDSEVQIWRLAILRHI